MSRLLLFGLLLIGVVVFAGTKPTSNPKPVHAATNTFTFEGIERSVTVPTGVTRVYVAAIGARGGPGCPAGVVGGVGGATTAILTVTQGDVLFVAVGGIGGTPVGVAGGAGGFNGGNVGGSNTSDPSTQVPAGGGGGASDVRTSSRVNVGSNATRLVVAGGGGGGAGCGETGVNAGGNGGAAGPNGVTGATGAGGVSEPGTGGGGGTQVAPGAGGLNPANGNNGAPGVGAIGGAGGSANNTDAGGAGGGGGGGLFGGGGGGSGRGDNAQPGGGGGGGGSNFITPAATTVTNGTSVSPASVTIIWLDPPTISKAFAPGSVALSGVTNLTITLTNNNAAGVFSTLTGITFTDNFAAQGLVITTGAVTGTPLCAGTITANAGTSIISMTNGTLAPGFCQITVQVRATLAGTQINTTGPISSIENTNGGTASQTLLVSVSAATFSKSFTPSTINVNGASTMTFNIVNPNVAAAMTGVAFTDNLAPLGITINGAFSNSCGGTLVAAIGGTGVVLTNGSIPANGSCSISIPVTSATPGTKVNTTSQLTSNELVSVGPATATLTVNAPLVATATPTPPATPTLIPVVIPIIPQVFQHVPQGIFNGTRNSTPTPVRPAAAPVAVAPVAPLVISPPNTGDAGLPRALKAPFAW